MVGSSPAAPPEFRYDIYISYSEVDAAWVFDRLLPRLEADGLRVAVDAVTFQPGVPVIEEIERSIRESRYVFAVLTPAYVADQWDNFESLLVQHQDPAARLRRLIPLLLEPCEPPPRIQLLHWVDLTDPTRREEQLHRVIDTVEGRARLPELHPEAAVPDAHRRWWEVRWFAVAGVSALLTLVLVAGWLWSQRAPAQMDSDTFNIAVAEFAVTDKDGNPLRDEIGRQRARNVASLLADQRDELQSFLNQPVTVWGDEQRICPVDAEDAAARAEALNAHVLVYGVVRRDGDAWTLQPEFYLTEEVVWQATELLGDHALGTPISFDAGRLAAQGNTNAELRARARALVQVIIGLSHYQGGRRADYEAALRAFQRAADDSDWGAQADSASGQEILYLFLGNAYLKSAPSMSEAPEEWAAVLAQGVSAYEQALARKQDYPRALNGYASALFQQARLFPDERWPCAEDWDWITLDEARTAYQQALDTPSAAKPISGNVDLRAHLGLGRIHYHIGFCLSDELFPPAWQLAQSNLAAAIAEYEAAPAEHLRLLAANAHQYLGDMAFLEADWRDFDESLDSDENTQRIAELSQSAQTHYQAGIDLIAVPKTEEALAQRVSTEGQLLRVLCFQGKYDEFQAHIAALSEEGTIPTDLLAAIQEHAKELCHENP